MELVSVDLGAVVVVGPGGVVVCVVSDGVVAEVKCGLNLLVANRFITKHIITPCGVLVMVFFFCGDSLLTF